MFPEIFSAREARRAIDGFVDDLVVNYADTLTAMSQPFLKILVWIEQLLRGAPWWSIILAVVILAYLASRRVFFSLSMGLLLFLMGSIGLWDAGMETLALMIMATVLSVLVGIPLGIITGKSKIVRSVMLPLLDVMQTLPSFVYLIPVVMLFGLGKIPAIIATVIYAVPPLIRLTDLGIRLVDKEVLEASRSFGANSLQQLFGVQLPLALPNIMAGLNQTTMMALSMVVISSMIGARGLGYEVLLGINRLEVGRGLLAGIGIVILAILFDRISQSYGKRIQNRESK
ncbi:MULTISPECIES: ABC transporter permease [Oligella]|uniref:Glycine betaine/L-proline transport system permease protein proW n=2 Tax=Oligella urethralis TaxID=90245 RepID=A0A2N6QBV2_9BURK|nr:MULTISPECIES: proline/glycine betaine ABC transporter permease [Oligella]AVL71992.1 ABC transporter permease [Oligella urethralis]OFS81941.1 ABC transporter permease [Oligella sp. HMSC05A10]OFV48791.1 ABC transporter permease [Oligella sp. HMSC09E12]PMC17005.1 ABC transporter permease [Oligella urethralis]SPY07856.1 Glycine betaine/L-proline transport system permease protein proW [Oligella urethralis]